MTNVRTKTLLSDLWTQIEAYIPLRGEKHSCRPELQEAFYCFPRHEFVKRFKYPDDYWKEAKEKGTPEFMSRVYKNRPLMYLDENGEVLQASNSEPAFIFHLVELLDIQPGQRVLEIGCGTGWLLAIMSHLVGDQGSVTGVEINQYLAQQAQVNIDRLGVKNASVVAGDGFTAYNLEPFDRIIITASVYEVSPKLISLLRNDGLAMIPIRNRGLSEEAHLLRRDADKLTSELTRVCKFVPMISGDVGRDGAILPMLKDNVTFQKVKDQQIKIAPLDFGQEHVSEMLRWSLPFTSFLSKVEPRFNGFVIG